TQFSAYRFRDAWNLDRFAHSEIERIVALVLSFAASERRVLSDDERFRGRRRPALLEPVNPFADQIELQRIAARLFRSRDLDGDVGAGAGAERLRQPGARVVAIEHAAVGGAELRAEADEAAAVAGLRRKRARREVTNARPNLQRLSGPGGERDAGHQRAHVDLRARHGAGNGVPQVVVVPDLVADDVEIG